MTAPRPEAPWDERRALLWEAYDHGGWEHLLPRGKGARWLCLDTLSGATTVLLSEHCEELHVVPSAAPHAAEIEHKARVRGASNVHLHPAGALPTQASDGRAFDGFVLCDTRGSLDSKRVADVIASVVAAVSPQGFVFVALRNRFDYTRLRRLLRQDASAAPGRYLANRAVRASLSPNRSVTAYPMLGDEHGRVGEVVAPGGYVTAKNPGTPMESARRWLLGKGRAPVFSPVVGWLARGPGSPPNRVEAAILALERRGLLAAGEARVKRYLVLRGGKVVISLGAGDYGAGAFIVILASAPQAAARRRQEFATLVELRGLPADLAGRIPQPFFEEDIDGTPAFVIQEFPGVTIDAPVALLDPATREAARFILRLHQATRRAQRVTAQGFVARWGPMLDAAAARYPALAAVLERVRGFLQQLLIGAELPVVWMHGDFKVENIVVDPASGRLEGVIDWELSEREGLPYLDLWYLVLYNRAIVEGTHFFPAVRVLFPGSQLRAGEAALCAEYAREMPIPATLVPALVATLMTHHCARRMLYDARDEPMMKQIAMLFEELMSGAGVPRDG